VRIPRNHSELTIDIGYSSEIVPTLADIRLQLTEKECKRKDLSRTVSTIMDGLAIEKTQ
jgi:hypothetical protein